MARGRTPVDLDELTARAEALVIAHGAVSPAEMKAFRPYLAEIQPRLVGRGLEVSKTIRRPLEGQLLALASRGFVAEKALDRRVAGASSREVKAAVAALLTKGALVRVLRETGVGVALPCAPILPREEVQRLLLRAVRLQKLLKKAQAKRGSELGILHEDVQSLLETSLTAPRDSSNVSEPLTLQIARRVREAHVPTRVPDLLRSLGVSAEAGKRALLDGASRGLFELEPESGMGRLSREDAEFCPSGPMGTRLSWVRTREQQGASS